ncbi:histidine kinase [Actinoplanes sp. NPDC051851]|uniref:sensor histidine kinase n=1 Tax=Actinoplanes sp. NPDC051851 TaxID=3154753 RepID=UPI003442FBDC
MHLTRSLRALPLGAWAALLWCVAAFVALRGYSGLPGMPAGLPDRPAWRWALVAVAVAAALAASAQVRSRPLPALYGLVLAAVIIVFAVGTAGLPGSPAILLAQFTVAADLVLALLVATRARWTWAVGILPVLAALPAGGLLGSRLDHPADGGGWDRTSTTIWVAYAFMPAVVAVLVGFLIRQTHNYARRLSDQAAVQAVVAERLRISRELHDHVAHNIGAIAFQAGAAARVMDTQPEQAREAVRAIESTSRETLAGLRRMLVGLRLRDESPGHPRENPSRPGRPGPQDPLGDALPLAPAPGLADIDGLVRSATTAGVTVDLCWAGTGRSLPAEVDLSAYRIIQESLTNVLRHSRASACRVSVEFSHAAVDIEVVDNGRAGYGFGGCRRSPLTSMPVLPVAAVDGPGDTVPSRTATASPFLPAGVLDDAGTAPVAESGRHGLDPVGGSAGPGGDRIAAWHGHSADAAGAGYGLLGLRERVALLNGSMTAGVLPEGGFRVAARLPAEPEDALR